MSRKRDWKQVGEVVEKVSELGLTLKEGAERFGVKVGLLYEYNKRQRPPLTEGSRRQVETPAKCSSVEAQDEAGKEGHPVVSDVERPGPSKCKSNLPSEVVELISDYRRLNPEHGFKRIQDHLKSKYLVTQASNPWEFQLVLSICQRRHK